MTRVECAELTVDEQLELAGALNDGLGGRAIALVRAKEIVFDPITGGEPRPDEVALIVKGFVAKREEGEHYSVEVGGDDVTVRSADPLARSRERKRPMLPPNLLQCPFCGFVTQYEEAYTVHYRSHGFV